MFMSDYVTEGEALSDWLECNEPCGYDWEFDREHDEDSYYTHPKNTYHKVRNKCKKSYTRSQKKAYLDNKSKFSKDLNGKYVIIQDPKRQKSIIKYLFLVDRNKTKQWWWTTNSIFAKIFSTIEEAQAQLNNYKYNNVRIMQIK